MFYIVCYDTPSNKRRRKLHSTLKNYAVTVQKSVFETFLEPPRFEEMMKKIKGMMDSGVDSVRIYSMTKDAQQQMRVIGMPGLLEDSDHILISESRPEMKPECLSLENEADSDDCID